MVFKGLFQLKSFFHSVILPYPGDAVGKKKTPLFKSSRREILGLIANLVWARGGDPAMQQPWSCFPDLLPFLQLKFASQMATPAAAAAAPWLLCWARLSPGTRPSHAALPGAKPGVQRERTPLPLPTDHRDDPGSRTEAGRRYLARNLFNLLDDSLPRPLHHFYGPAACAGPARPGGRCGAQPALPSERLIHHR